MQYIWRPTVRKYIEERYIQNPKEWYDLTISTSGLLNITIISEHFVHIAVSQRREQILDLLLESNAPTSIGFLSLYTTSEADSIGLPKPPTIQSGRVDNWSDLAQQAMNVSGYAREQPGKQGIPRTVTFYSFKGGVGRTTALTHVAWILAMRGRKIVAVDLDLEAPGLSSLFHLAPMPKYGIVDYFYERSYLPQGIEPSISIAEIFGEAPIPDAPGRLFIVPAGFLDLNYITKVDDLRASVITERGEDLWSIFFREITEQLQPDIILIDSRTGINEWGAFSLLRAADQAIVFLYPNEQNKRGIALLLDALAGSIPLQLVFSPVPFGDTVREKVREYWQDLQGRLGVAAGEVNGDEDKESQELEAQSDLAEPITIYYLTELALASSYPVLPLLPNYMNIANVVDEDTTAISREQVLSDIDSRQKIIESLKFPAVNAADPGSDQNLRNLFQRTTDFEQFLDDTTCLIRGRKGTGKTALYELLLKYEEVARELSNKRLDRVTCFSGHGRFRIRPTRDEFQRIAQSIEQNKGSWEAFWRFYLLLRMYLENQLQRYFKGNRVDKFNPLKSVLGKLPAGVDSWQIEHTRLLAEMATDSELNLLAKDLLDEINRQLQKSGKILWFLYDDLDEDLLEKGNVRKGALTGLFQLIQASDARRLVAIRFKIFLREDIWSRLVFDNKSHLNGRDIILKWTRKDFLRLALRQALQSKEFRDVVDRFAPVENIDQAEEALIDKALQLLWGTRREPNLKSKYVSRWVYDRLTDSSETTFPRSLNILLKEAKNHELHSHRDQLTPPDRLLQATSLNQGLFVASKQRCEEVREEYPEFEPFFDALTNLEVLILERKLREVWQDKAREIVPTFESFVEFLLSIGLIGLAELQEKKRGYRFAEIYTYGFNMYRGKRKY